MRRCAVAVSAPRLVRAVAHGRFSVEIEDQGTLRLSRSGGQLDERAAAASKCLDFNRQANERLNSRQFHR